MNLARYALFREDIRDLASLTTDKVSNLLVVNTLKVGKVVNSLENPWVCLPLSFIFWFLFFCFTNDDIIILTGTHFWPVQAGSSVPVPKVSGQSCGGFRSDGERKPHGSDGFFFFF